MSKTYKHRKRITVNGQTINILADTKAELAAKEALKRDTIERDEILLAPSTTVKTWAAKWLHTYKEPNVSATTLKDYCARLDQHILPAIGHMKIKNVKSSHLQDILNDMSGFSKDRIAKARNTLTQLFSAALMNGLVLKSPAVGLMLPKATDGTRRSITPYERQISLETAETHPAGPWVLTMLYCGLRPQETAALLGRHVDLKNGVLHIEQALKKDGTIGPTKTGAGTRDVPIPPELRSFFEEAARSPFSLVFTSSNGRPLNNTNWGRMWDSFKKAMQINAGARVRERVNRNKTVTIDIIPPFPIAGDLVPYCYRHTFCTDLQDAGVPINVAKDLMGHSSIDVTAKIYTHMTGEQMKRTAERIAAHRAGLPQATLEYQGGM
jgi:integrase